MALYPTFWCLSVFDVLNLSLSVVSDNFMLFKMDVAKQAINSRSGKAIPPKVRQALQRDSIKNSPFFSSVILLKLFFT